MNNTLKQLYPYGVYIITRRRRDVMFLARMPGTQWCGAGSRANSSNDLGGHQTADSCCRMHDTACPYYIERFTENYGVYNWRAYTLNHCDCDERYVSKKRSSRT